MYTLGFLMVLAWGVGIQGWQSCCTIWQMEKPLPLLHQCETHKLRCIMPCTSSFHIS